MDPRAIGAWLAEASPEEDRLRLGSVARDIGHGLGRATLDNVRDLRDVLLGHRSADPWAQGFSAALVTLLEAAEGEKLERHLEKRAVKSAVKRGWVDVLQELGGGERRHKELREALDIDKGQLSRQLADMASHGLIHIDGAGRNKVFSLTVDGKKALARHRKSAIEPPPQIKKGIDLALDAMLQLESAQRVPLALMQSSVSGSIADEAGAMQVTKYLEDSLSSRFLALRTDSAIVATRATPSPAVELVERWYGGGGEPDFLAQLRGLATKSSVVLRSDAAEEKWRFFLRSVGLASSIHVVSAKDVFLGVPDSITQQPWVWDDWLLHEADRKRTDAPWTSLISKVETQYTLGRKNDPDASPELAEAA